MKNLLLGAAAVLTCFASYAVDRNIEVYDKEGNQILCIPIENVDRIDIVELPEEVDLYGDGTEDNPYTVLGAINADKVEVPVYITGYMVGYFYLGTGGPSDWEFGLPPADHELRGRGLRGVVIADTKEETDPNFCFAIIAVDDKEGEPLNLKLNPQNYRKKVTVIAKIEPEYPRNNANYAQIISIED